jgi:oxygen-independent coproporphyrinogen-3 oxidase
MKLCLVGHSHRYSIDQAVVGLLGRKAVFCETVPEDDGEDLLISKLSYGGKIATAKAELILNGERFIETAKADLSVARTESERIRLEQHALKLAVFKAIRSATGEKYPWGSLTGMRPTKLVLRMLEEGLAPASARRHLIGRYLLEPERAGLAVEAAGFGYRTKRLFGEKDISLYVGIPFCPTRCAYCSFVSSETGKSAHLIEPYLERLFGEIRIRGELLRELGLDVRTVYFGGGTPTSLSASQLDRLMNTLRREIPLDGVLEYTVEAGRPDTITPEKLRVLKENASSRRPEA